MKKATILTLAVALVMSGFIGFASAAQNVANTTQKGSLLMFPKIEVSPYKDTIIEINNDYNKGIDLQCFWVNSLQEPDGFSLTLKANQPVWFSAADGEGTAGVRVTPFNKAEMELPVSTDGQCPSYVGMLQCFAVLGDQPVSHNHLYGSAMIVDLQGGNAVEYNSWNFTARGVAQGKAVGSIGKLELKGSNGGYDACPQYLASDFVSANGKLEAAETEIYGLGTGITLVPCIQDLRQDREPTFTKAKFDIWSEYGTKYSGAYKCIKCYFDGVLHEMFPVPDPFSVFADDDEIPIGDFTIYIGAYGAEKFTEASLHTAKGRFRVQGISSTVCENARYGQYCPWLEVDATAYFQAAGIGPIGSSQACPLLGLVFKAFSFNGESGLLGEGGFAVTASEPSNAGYDATGVILYDGGIEVVPEFAR